MESLMLSAAKAKPQVRLGHALSIFEESLNNERKAIFRSYRNQAANCTPTLDDVRRAVAESDQKSGSRPYGSRFVNILKAVQQFSVVGDVIVGGGGNIVPSAVWGCLRLTLTVVTNIASCREKVSELFMEIGQTAPRHEQIGVLYPSSKRLQSDLIEYFIVIVQLCHRLFRPSTLGKITARLQLALVDPELKNLKEELDKWALSIDREINLLIAQRIEEEAKENSRFRSLWVYTSEAETKRKKIKSRLTWLDLCSRYNYEREQKSIRKQGNATFFLSDEQYVAWKEHGSDGPPRSSNLLLRGILGSGKSVLLASMVDDLILAREERNYSVAYFFVINEDTESQKARTILGSIARQILEPLSDLSWVDSLDTASRPSQDLLSAREILGLVAKAFPGGRRVFLVLDGLDQCPRNERLDLLSYLEALRRTLNLFVCSSLRQEANVHPERDLVLALQPEFVLDIPIDNPDIRTFVNSELDALMELGELVVGSGEVLEEIKTCLIDGAGGMFLWVVLQLQTITLERSDQAIRQALRDIPKSLPATYEQILKKSRGFGPQYQHSILKILSAAFEVLNIDQLREALSIVPGDICWSDDRLINDVNVTLASCGSLIKVDEEELTVRFVHPSVRQFLFDEIKDAAVSSDTDKPYRFSHQEAHNHLAGIMVTYMAIFKTTKPVILHEESSAKVEKPTPTLVPPPSQAINTVLQSGGMSRRLVGVISRMYGGSAVPMSVKAPIDIGAALSRNQTTEPMRNQRKKGVLLPYAKLHWLMHSKCLDDKDGRIYNLWLRNLRSYDWDKVSKTYHDDLKIEGVFQIVVTKLLPIPFVWAMIYSHHLLLDQQLKEHRKKDKLKMLVRCVETIKGATPVDPRMATRCLTLALLLRDRGAHKTNKLLTMNPDLGYGKYGTLYLAVILGNYPVVRRLIRCMLSNTRKETSQALVSLPYPLIERAVQNSDTRTLRLLITHGANADTHTEAHRHPLVEALTSMVNSKDPDPRHILIVYLLLKATGKSNRNLPRDLIRSQSYNVFDAARAMHIFRLYTNRSIIREAESYVQPKKMHVKLYNLWLDLKDLSGGLLVSVLLVLFIKNTYTSLKLQTFVRMVVVFFVLGICVPVLLYYPLAAQAGLLGSWTKNAYTSPPGARATGQETRSPVKEFSVKLVGFWVCFAPLAAFLIFAPPNPSAAELANSIFRVTSVVVISAICFGFLWLAHGSTSNPLQQRNHETRSR
ncbi:hypothetical protein V8F20_002480 [Naviculisporaceae sp. PSN 640]